MRVVLADIDEALLANAETELRTLGGAVLGVKTDVSKRSDVEVLARRTRDTLGHVHLLVNNAGVAAGGSPWQATWNDWECVIGIDFWGVAQALISGRDTGRTRRYFNREARWGASRGLICEVAGTLQIQDDPRDTRLPLRDANSIQ